MPFDGVVNSTNKGEGIRANIFAEWFKKYFQAGKFLMLGPYIDTEAHEGVIFAETESPEELQKILEEDCYYPNFADYHIREFAPKMIATDIARAIKA